MFWISKADFCFPLDCYENAGNLMLVPQVIFPVCGYTSIVCTVTKTVFPQMKFDNHFTHLVFWILHGIDMINS